MTKQSKFAFLTGQPGGGGGGAPAPHAASHQDGGADEVSVAGLSGLLADPQTPASHTHPISEIVGLTNPMLFQGAINVAADFPTVAAVQNGWTFRVDTDVTDNDVTKTNTGQSFFVGDEIAWNGTDWTPLGSDGAVHVNRDSEISGVTEKVTPVAADLLLIEDSADSNNKKRVQVGNLPAGAPGAHEHSISDIKTAALFNAASQELSRAHDAAFNFSGDRTLSFFVKLLDNPALGDTGVIQKWGADPNKSYLIRFAGNGANDLYTIDLVASGDGSFSQGALLSSLLKSGKWYHVLIEHENGVEFRMSIDDLANDSSPWAFGVNDNNEPFEILRNNGNFKIARLAKWSRLLSTEEKTCLYNAGKGLRYENYPVGLLTSLDVSYDLDEISGSRVDSVGALDLTDVNSVGSSADAPALKIPSLPFDAPAIVRHTFHTNTDLSLPGSQWIEFNNSDPSLVTRIAVGGNNVQGQSLEKVFHENLRPGDYLHISADDPAKFIIAQLTGEVDGGTVGEFDVTIIQSGVLPTLFDILTTRHIRADFTEYVEASNGAVWLESGNDVELELATFYYALGSGPTSPVTGLTTPGGNNSLYSFNGLSGVGRRVTFYCAGGDPLVFTHDDAASLSENRFSLPNGEDLFLQQGEFVTFTYRDNNNKWLVSGGSFMAGYKRFVTPTAIAANQNDYVLLNFDQFDIVRLEATGATREITGMAVQNAFGPYNTLAGRGKELRIKVIGSEDIRFMHQDVASQAQNRFALSTGADITVASGETITFLYDPTDQRWSDV